MPLYDLKCANGHEFERMIRLVDFEEDQFCPCGLSAQRIIRAPMFSVDNVGYSCPISGDWIGSKRQHEENLKQHNCRVRETGETEAAARRRHDLQSSFDRSVDETVEREWDSLPSVAKENVANELTRAGADLQIERSTPNVN